MLRNFICMYLFNCNTRGEINNLSLHEDSFGNCGISYIWTSKTLSILNGLNYIVNQNLIDQFNKKLTSELSISSNFIFIVKAF